MRLMQEMKAQWNGWHWMGNMKTKHCRVCCRNGRNVAITAITEQEKREKLADVCEALLKGGEPDYYEEWKSLIPFDLKSVKIEQLLKEAPSRCIAKFY